MVNRCELRLTGNWSRLTFLLFFSPQTEIKIVTGPGWTGHQNKQKYPSQSKKWLRTLVWKTKHRYLSPSTFFLPCLFFLPLPIVTVIVRVIVMSHWWSLHHSWYVEVRWGGGVVSTTDLQRLTGTSLTTLRLSTLDFLSALRSVITRRDQTTPGTPVNTRVNCQYLEFNRIDLWSLY